MRGTAYFTALSDEWGEGVRQVFRHLPELQLVTGLTVDTFIVTCEHGGNRIPAPYRPLFRGQKALLDSHRGYDPGCAGHGEGTRRCLRGALGVHRQSAVCSSISIAR